MPLEFTSMMAAAHIGSIMSQRGGGTYCFWCGFCQRLRQRSFLSALYLLNQCVDLDQTSTDTLLGQGKEMIWFWWPWPRFQGHTSTECHILTQNSFSAPYLLNQMMDSDQTLCIVSLRKLKGLIGFWWPSPNFQGHHTFKTVKWALSAVYLVNK